MNLLNPQLAADFDQIYPTAANSFKDHWASTAVLIIQYARSKKKLTFSDDTLINQGIIFINDL